MHDKLNAEQIAALKYTKTPLLICGPVNSGKRTVLIHKTSEICKSKKRTDRCLFLTTSPYAVADVQAKLKELKTDLSALEITTIRSWALHYLRENLPKKSHPVMIQYHERLKLIQWLLEANEKAPSLKLEPTQILFRLRLLKQTPRIIEGYLKQKKSTVIEKTIQEVIKSYQNLLNTHQIYDEEDLMMHVYKHLKKNLRRPAYKYILIDRYEDLNETQKHICRLLMNKKSHLTAISDPNQSLNPNGISAIQESKDFLKEYPKSKIAIFQHQYGATQPIHYTTNTLNLYPWPNKVQSHGPNGESMCLFVGYNEAEESEWLIQKIQALIKLNPTLTLKDFGIFYRTQSQITALQQALEKQQMGYHGVAHHRDPVVSKLETTLITIFLRLIQNPKDDLAWLALLDWHPFGIKAGSIKAMQAYLAKTNRPLAEYLFSKKCPLPKKCLGIGQGLVGTIIELNKVLNQKQSPKLKIVINHLIKQWSIKARLEKENTLDALEALEKLDSIINKLDSNQPKAIWTHLDDGYLGLKTPNIEPQDNGISLVHIKEAKDFRFKHVFIIGFEDGILPHYDSLFDEELVLAERRLLYSAVSRAELGCYFTAVQRRYIYNRLYINELSRFLLNLPKIHLACFVSDRINSGSEKLLSRLNEAAIVYQITNANQEIKPKYCKLIFRHGDKIQHQILGRGIIKTIEGQGPEAVLTISFHGMVKKLMARYAPIVRV